MIPEIPRPPAEDRTLVEGSPVSDNPTEDAFWDSCEATTEVSPTPAGSTGRKKVPMSQQQQREHEEGLVALTGMSASPQLQKTTSGALAAGVTIYQILAAIYAHKDDILAAIAAIQKIWASVSPATVPATTPTPPTP